MFSFDHVCASLIFLHVQSSTIFFSNILVLDSKLFFHELGTIDINVLDYVKC
jgi:hypothetical protein